MYTARYHPWGVSMPHAKFVRDLPKNVAVQVGTKKRTDRNSSLYTICAFLYFVIDRFSGPARAIVSEFVS